MKKLFLGLIIGISMLHTSTAGDIQRSELEQIKEEIQDLKLNASKQITVEKYAIDQDIDDFLNEFYTGLGGNKSYRLKKYKIVSDASRARIHYINVKAEVEWELSSNDEKLKGTSSDSLQLMNLDGKFSIVSMVENNEV